MCLVKLGTVDSLGELILLLIMLKFNTQNLLIFDISYLFLHVSFFTVF